MSESTKNAIAIMMDDEIREELHFLMAPCSFEVFLAEYCERHFEKYGTEFVWM